LVVLLAALGLQEFQESVQRKELDFKKFKNVLLQNTLSGKHRKVAKKPC